MFAQIHLNNIDDLCRGASFLGSGGGGDIHELLPMTRSMLTVYGPVPLLSLDKLHDDDFVAAIEFVGAPVPHNQRHHVEHFNLIGVLEHAISDLGTPIQALFPVEIGGANALTPLCVAGKAKLPIVDGDLLGRAFPEISMISTNVYNLMPSKAYIADPETGISHVIECSSYEELESKARAIAIQHRTTAAVLIPIILRGREAKRAIVRDSFTHALSIGAQPTLECLSAYIKGTMHGIGVVTKYDCSVVKGFLSGTILLETESGDELTIHVKNEYLSLEVNGHQKIKAPDIISLLKMDPLMSVLSDQINVGESVACLSCRGPELWYTPRGLKLTEQACFT